MTTSMDISLLYARAHALPDGLATDGELLDEVLNKLAEWEPANSAEDEKLAVEWVNVLDLVISKLDSAIDLTLYGRVFRRMRKLCGPLKNLPTLFYVPDDIEEDESFEPLETNYSDVKRGKRRSGTVALKIIRAHTDGASEIRKSFYKEAVTLRYVKHENIVPFYGVLEPSAKRPVALISQWMPNETLFKYLQKSTNESRLPFIVQTLSGLQFIHSLDLAHGDLKAENILVDDPPIARLADFGFSVSISHTLGTTGNSPGTPGFVAPELLESLLGADPRDGPKASVQADMYAFASVLYQIFELKRPFWNDKRKAWRRDRHIVEKDLRPSPRPTHPELTDKIWNIMGTCWNKDPSKRLLPQEILRYLKSEDELASQASV